MYASSFANSGRLQRAPAAVDQQSLQASTTVQRWARLAFLALSRHDKASFSTAFSMRDPADHARLAKVLKYLEELDKNPSVPGTLSSTITSILVSVADGSNAQVVGVLEQFFKFLLVWATDKITLDRVLDEYAAFYRDLLTLLKATTPMGPPIWPLVSLIHRQMIAVSRQVDYARNVPNKASAVDAAWNQVFAVLPLSNFPVPLRSAYHAFLGKRAMLVNDDATAEANLTRAIHLTSRQSTRNLRILMCQLIAVRLSAGQPPPQRLLEQYQMAAQWTPVLTAMRTCNFPAVEQAIDHNVEFFRAHGVYGALLERPRAVMMRLCVRKCVNIWRDLFAPTDTHGRGPRIHMRFYAAAFDLMFHDEPWHSPADSIHAAYLRVNNLIARGLLRGFVLPATGDHYVSKFRDIKKTVPALAISAPAAPTSGFAGGDSPAVGFAMAGQSNGFGDGLVNGFSPEGGQGAFASPGSSVPAFAYNSMPSGGFGQPQNGGPPGPFGTVQAPTFAAHTSTPPSAFAPSAPSGVPPSAFMPPSGFLATMPGMGSNPAAPQAPAFGGLGPSSNGPGSQTAWNMGQQPQQSTSFGGAFGGFSGFNPST